MGLMDKLGGVLDEADTRAEEQRKKADEDEFQAGYKRVKGDGDFRLGETIYLSFMRGDRALTEGYQLWQIGVPAERFRAGELEIKDGDLRPRLRGQLLGGVEGLLDEVIKRSRRSDDHVLVFNAMGAAYLGDLMGDERVADKLKEIMEKQPEVAPTVERILGEYAANELRKAIGEELETGLKRAKEIQDAKDVEAFERGRTAVVQRGGLYGMETAHVVYKIVATDEIGGEDVRRFSADKLAERMRTGEIEDFRTPPYAKGQMYGAARIGLETAVKAERVYDAERELREAITLLYVIGRLEDEIGLVGEVLKVRPGLADTVREEIAKYE
ncbi:hypothetical protein ACFL0V_07595 [Nanoarchaeota archaeon]